MMKVCINFGDIRCVVPVGDGSLAVRDVIDLAVERFRKATAKVSLLAKFTSKKDRAQSSVLGSRQIIKSTLCSSLCLPLDISSLSLHKLTLTNSLRKHHRSLYELVRHTIFIRLQVLYRTVQTSASVSVSMFYYVLLFVRLLQAPTEDCVSCMLSTHALTVHHNTDEL